MGQLWVDKEATGPRPLDSFPLIRSRNFEEVRQALIQTYSARYVNLPFRTEGFDFRANHWQSQNTTLSHWSCPVSLQLEFPPANFFRLAFVRDGADIRFGRIERQVTSEEPCVVPPGVLLTAAFTYGFEQLGLRINADTLLNKLAALMGATPSRKLVFDQTTRSNGQATGNLRRMVMFFAGELDALGSKIPSLALVELEQAVIVSFICNNPHNYSAFLESRTHSAASWQVRRAEEYIEAHWDQPITIEALARATLVSARSLFHQFKRGRGQSPMAFVKEVRLRRARDMLGQTDANPSVTETALACGFSNFGHFAKDYFKRFGERPSDTIKRGKGDLASIRSRAPPVVPGGAHVYDSELQGNR